MAHYSTAPSQELGAVRVCHLLKGNTMTDPAVPICYIEIANVTRESGIVGESAFP